MPFNLPQTFEVNLPDLQEFANGAIGFEPNPDLPRVSDPQREQDALAYREQMNAAANLKDSIQVANKYVDAGICCDQTWQIPDSVPDRLARHPIRKGELPKSRRQNGDRPD